MNFFNNNNVHNFFAPCLTLTLCNFIFETLNKTFLSKFYYEMIEWKKCLNECLKRMKEQSPMWNRLCAETFAREKNREIIASREHKLWWIFEEEFSASMDFGELSKKNSLVCIIFENVHGNNNNNNSAWWTKRFFTHVAQINKWVVNLLIDACVVYLMDWFHEYLTKPNFRECGARCKHKWWT